MTNTNDLTRLAEQFKGRADDCGTLARAILADRERQAGEAVAWEGGEGWEPLAWELCAEENGEESCNELIWEGGPAPEPWGERWLKYEDEAKRLIKLVHKHASLPAPQAVLADSRALALLRESRNTLLMWRDVAPAVSLLDDIDKFLAAAPSPDGKAEQDRVPSKEWLAEKLAMGPDDECAAGQPKAAKRPCDTPPGCNGSNCLECDDFAASKAEQAEAPSDKDRADYWQGRAIVSERKLATQPTASNAGEREAFASWIIREHPDLVPWLSETEGAPDTHSGLHAMHLGYRAALATKPPAGEQKPVARLLTAQEVQRCTLGLGGQASASAVQRQFASVNGVRIEGQETAACAQCGGAGSITATDGTGPYNCFACKPQPEQVAQDSAYPSDIEIDVPPIDSQWGHSNGDTYTVTGYADMFSDSHQRRPPRIIYRSAKTGRVWSREHSDWHRAMKPLGAARARGEGARHD